MVPRLKPYRRRYGAPPKRYGLYHKTQGVPEEWAFDDRKKQIFGLLSRKKQIFGLLCSMRKSKFSVCFVRQNTLD